MSLTSNVSNVLSRIKITIIFKFMKSSFAIVIAKIIKTIKTIEIVLKSKRAKILNLRKTILKIINRKC